MRPCWTYCWLRARCYRTRQPSFSLVLEAKRNAFGAPQPWKIEEAMVDTMRIGSLELEVPLAVGTMQWGTTWLDNKLNRGRKKVALPCVSHAFSMVLSYF